MPASEIRAESTTVFEGRTAMKFTDTTNEFLDHLPARIDDLRRELASAKERVSITRKLLRLAERAAQGSNTSAGAAAAKKDTR
jgi:hypothetical protein